MLGSDFSTVKVFDLDDEDCMTGLKMLVGMLLFFYPKMCGQYLALENYRVRGNAIVPLNLC